MQQAFDAGIKAYGVGKNEEALRAFEAAIRGGLPSAQMPRMLYYRGLAFRKLGKPGFAVSDLTSALWLKPGLSEAERADAIKVRALAYNEAGISNVPPVPHVILYGSADASRPEQTGSRRAHGNGREHIGAGRFRCAGCADTVLKLRRRHRLLLKSVRRRLIQLERASSSRRAFRHGVDRPPAGAIRRQRRLGAAPPRWRPRALRRSERLRSLRPS